MKAASRIAFSNKSHPRARCHGWLWDLPGRGAVWVRHRGKAKHGRKFQVLHGEAIDSWSRGVLGQPGSEGTVWSVQPPSERGSEGTQHCLCQHFTLKYCTWNMAATVRFQMGFSNHLGHYFVYKQADYYKLLEDGLQLFPCPSQN